MHQYIKNYSDMKRLLVLTILVLGRTLLPHVAINAQTYYNFAFAEATYNSGKGLSGQLTAQLLCRITRKATGIKP